MQCVSDSSKASFQLFQTCSHAQKKKNITNIVLVTLNLCDRYVSADMQITWIC